jgi:mRNA interferase HigB
MKLVGLPLLHHFALVHRDVQSWLEACVAEVMEANWNSPMEVKARYPSASFLGKQRVVFNLKGNKYRLLAKIAYKTGTVLIRAIGTHEEYDQWEL